MEEGSFCLDRDPGSRVVESGEPRPGDGVVGPALDSERALPWCGRDDLGRDDLADPPPKAETGETGHREDEGVGLAVVEATQTGIDIAMERTDPQVWPAGWVNTETA